MSSMSRVHAQLSALQAAGAVVHAIRYSTLSSWVLWEKADRCADYYVVLRYFTQHEFGEHVGLVSLCDERGGELREYRVHGPGSGRVTPHLGVYVLNPGVDAMRFEVVSTDDTHVQVVEADTCPLVLAIWDVRSCELRLLHDAYEVKLRVFVDAP